MRGFTYMTASGLLAAATAWASTGSGDIPAPTQQLLDAYPGLQVQMENGRIWAFHGQKMNSASTPQQAAEWWLADHGDAFNVADLVLRLERSNTVNPNQTWTVFAYKQYMEGLPVEFGYARIVVGNGSVSTVNLVTGKLATPPVAGFAADTITADDALEIAQASHGGLTVWSTPDQVVYYGQDDTIGNITPVRAWKIRGENTLSGALLENYSFFINAADGSMTFIRDEKISADIEGQVHGNGTPWGKDATRPDIPENPPTDLVMGDVQVDANGVKVQSLDEDGSFVIAGQGDANTTVLTDLIGPFSRLFNDNAGNNDELQVDVPFVVGQENVDILFNPVPGEFTTSQVNAHLHANITHDYYTDHQPTSTMLGQVQTHANAGGTCNAFFSAPNTISFLVAEDPDGSNGCPNMAYSSVVAHEYGHYVVNQLGLSQGSFGEGYGDAIGAIIYDDPITGRDFFQVGEDLRNPIEANKQYPCSSEIHECGMVLSGVWWDVNLNLALILDEQEAIDLVRQRFTDWSEITVGGSGNDALFPTSAIEVLEVFDDDGDPGTAGPYDQQVCSAFAKHGILCPGIDTILTFTYLNVTPAELEANGLPCDVETKMCFVVGGGDLGEPAPNSAKFQYKLLTEPPQPFIEVALTEVALNTYEAIFPATADTTIVRFSVSASTVTGAQEQDPADGTKYDATYSCAAPAVPTCDIAAPCEGDVNGDLVIDPLDSGFSLSRFGCSVGTGDEECDAADANGDGIVDPLDVGYILSRFGVCE